ncbi:hypothetical protein ACFVFH_29035 [Streptomyces sp. NPDC057697]|uniref:hypothetical protein n=1 Tax=Streptomyces sp. NPDC057697 TaxID=3346219 RepID=UPI0036B09BCF
MWGAGALLGALVLLVAGGGFAASVPESIATVREFRVAAPCTDRAARTGCLRTYTATVRSTERTGGRSPRHEVGLDGPPDVPWVMEMGSDEPLFKRLRAGDEVTVTLWRDHATALEHDGVRQHSTDSPESDPEWQAGLAVACLVFGCYLLFLGGFLLARAREVAAHGLPRGIRFFGTYAPWAALAVIPAGIAGAFASSGRGHENRGWLVLVAVWTALLPAVYAGVRWREARGRHAARGSAVRPSGDLTRNHLTPDRSESIGRGTIRGGTIRRGTIRGRTIRGRTRCSGLRIPPRRRRPPPSPHAARRTPHAARRTPHAAARPNGRTPHLRHLAPPGAIVAST